MSRFSKLEFYREVCRAMYLVTCVQAITTQAKKHVGADRASNSKIHFTQVIGNVRLNYDRD